MGQTKLGFKDAGRTLGDQLPLPAGWKSAYVCEWDATSKAAETPAILLADKAPRIVSRAIAEICNTPWNDVNPCLTSDGLIIVWMSFWETGGRESFIYISRRENLDSPFIKPKKLFAGWNPVITSNGQSIFFCDSTRSSVHEARRIANSDDFEPFRTADGLNFPAYPTGITTDGLILFVDIHPPPTDETQTIAHSVRRASVAAEWEKPLPIKVELKDRFYRVRTIAASPIPGRDSAIICMMLVKITQEANEETWPVFLSRAKSSEAYTEMERFSVPSTSGEYDPSLNLRIFNPRYNSITKELVFQSLDLHLDAPKNNNDVDIWVVKGFDPKSRGETGK